MNMLMVMAETANAAAGLFSNVSFDPIVDILKEVAPTAITATIAIGAIRKGFSFLRGAIHGA